jgi:hydrogenase-1 operon protein HyaF
MEQTTSSLQFNIQVSDQLTWNVKPLLHEVRHALDNLITSGETAIIDLRSIPLAPGEEDRILNLLGRGEVVAQLAVLGSSEIIETTYAGVWVVTHRNDDSEIVGRFIEVTTMPDILRSQTDDILEAYNHLSLMLQDDQESSESSVEK